jgi:hypothetical protein
MFGSFDKAFAEAALSRLFSGIHFWFDGDDKLTVDQCIGQAISGRLSFKDDDRHRQAQTTCALVHHVGEQRAHSAHDVVKPYNEHFHAET